MVPVMAISRAVLVHPVAMVAWVDAEHPVDTTDRTANRTADNTANRTGGGIALRRAALHSAKNALGLGRKRRGEQDYDQGYSEFLPHRHFSILSTIALL
ncbi:MAG: hypothetical protein ACREDM_06570 [Methylocella sp.]